MRVTTTTLVLVGLLVVPVGVASFVQSQETTTEETDLDRREANVVGVEIERTDARSYDFAVTLFHDDDGEPGYADRWQVETLNGTELGRRDLLHAHGTQPFTRSERIEVPANVSLVVVRGHDQTHSFGGQAMVVAPRTGATEKVRQGPDARNVSECRMSLAVASETATTTTPTATATTTTGSEADLVDCPWEENATVTTTA